MSGLGFLLIVVVVTLVGSLIVWLRNRKPTYFMASVDDFEREMRALDGLPAPTGSHMPRANPSGIHENRRPRYRMTVDGDSDFDLGDDDESSDESSNGAPYEDNDEGR